jgi:hypothetical protein
MSRVWTPSFIFHLLAPPTTLHRVHGFFLSGISVCTFSSLPHLCISPSEMLYDAIVLSYCMSLSALDMASLHGVESNGPLISGDGKYLPLGWFVSAVLRG